MTIKPASRADGMEGPLVSCIINFHNEENYLAEAIQSVREQSYRNWEILLIDDGSSDRSGAIATYYSSAEPRRIRSLAHPDAENRGSSASRNLGLQQARGRLVAFLDADDTWFPDKLEKQVSLFRGFPDAVMVCGSTEYWNGWQSDRGGTDEVIFTGDLQHDGGWVRGLEQDRLYAAGELLPRLYPLGRGMTPSLSGMMVRRDDALRLGGFEEEFRGLFDDQVLRAKLYLAGPIYVSSLSFDRYRQHDESLTHLSRGSRDALELRRRYLRWLKQYLRECGHRDPAVDGKLLKAFLKSDYPRLYRLLRRLAGAFPRQWRAN